MKFYSVLIAVAALLVNSVAADFLITSPVAGTVWQAGQPMTITWVPTGPTGFDPNGNVQIEVLRGDPNALTLVGAIGAVKETSSSFTFTPPPTWVNGADYAIRMGTRYSAMFSVAGGAATGPANPPAPAATPPSPSTPLPTTNTTAPSSTPNNSSNSTVPQPTENNRTAMAAASGKVSASIAALVPVGVALYWL